LTNHAPEEITGHQPRPFLSICQSRRICTVCGHIIFGQQQHNCIAPPQQQQQLQQQAVECNKCKGPHLPEQPCYIQPLPIDQNFDNNEELNQEVEIEEQQQQAIIKEEESFCDVDIKNSELLFKAADDPPSPPPTSSDIISSSNDENIALASSKNNLLMLPENNYFLPHFSELTKTGARNLLKNIC